MPAVDRKQGEEAGDRETDDGSLGCELRPFAHPVGDAMVLAAAERAELHKPRSGPGVMLGDVFAHMGFIYNGAATRQLRPRLDALLSAGALEQTRRRGIKLWMLTSTGRRRLAHARRKSEAAELPESPQHRKWRHSRTTAGEQIDGYRDELRTLIDEADALLGAGTQAHSDSWFCLAARLPTPAAGIGAAIHCLMEWPEPDDARPDIDDYSDPEDAELDAEKRARLRYLRTGRRHMLRGEVGV
ncbi:MAG: hypothetical protein ACRDK4_02460 [Solirubrobacteraceae bacterium]